MEELAQQRNSATLRRAQAYDLGFYRFDYVALRSSERNTSATEAQHGPSAALLLHQRGGAADCFGVPGAHGSDELRQGHAESMRDPVEGADPGGDAAGLDLDDRLPMDACGLGQAVDRPASGLALTGDLDAEGAQVRCGSRHAFQRGIGASFAQSPKRAYSR